LEQTGQANTDKSKKVWAGLSLLVLTFVIVGSAVVSSGKSSPAMRVVAVDNTTQSSSTPTASPASTPSTPTGSTTSSSTYKDGSYSATGSYDSPAGTESVKVSLTLASDRVTAATVVSEANDPTAASYQMNFISGYKPFVIGKDITAIKVSNVSGSSLTSIGFKDALAKIERQAQS
jgi:uncharacterized protein with FMN-binding domain